MSASSASSDCADAVPGGPPIGRSDRPARTGAGVRRARFSGWTGRETGVDVAAAAVAYGKSGTASNDDGVRRRQPLCDGPSLAHSRRPSRTLPALLRHRRSNAVRCVGSSRVQREGRGPFESGAAQGRTEGAPAPPARAPHSRPRLSPGPASASALPTSRPRSSIEVCSRTLRSSPLAWRSACSTERATLTVTFDSTSG